MVSGDKNKYSDKQKRQAEHIEKGYENRGVPKDTAERIGWSTVNKIYGGGKKGGSATHQKPGNKETNAWVSPKRGAR